MISVRPTRCALALLHFEIFVGRRLGNSNVKWTKSEVLRKTLAHDAKKILFSLRIPYPLMPVNYISRLEFLLSPRMQRVLACPTWMLVFFSYHVYASHRSIVAQVVSRQGHVVNPTCWGLTPVLARIQYAGWGATFVTVSGHLATREFRHQPSPHQGTTSPPTTRVK